MLENIMFSLDSVMPFFLLILLGYFLRRTGILGEDFFGSVNKFVYRVALPANLFFNASSSAIDIRSNARFLAVTFLLIFLSFCTVWIISELVFKDKTLIGTVVQGSFRGNYAILGVPLAAAVAGQHAAALAAMAIAVVIPTYSTLAITGLVSRGTGTKKPGIKSIATGIITTPLFVAAIVGIIWSALHIPMPKMVSTALGFVGDAATPLGLIPIGGLFSAKSAADRLRPALFASCIKILILPAVMVSVCYMLGFRGAELFLFFVIFGAPVAISSYSVATELGGDGPLASNILIITTFFSAFTLSLGIYIMRTVGWV